MVVRVVICHATEQANAALHIIANALFAKLYATCSADNEMGTENER